MFYKQIRENIITMLGESNAIPSTAIEISQDKYNSILEVIKNKPNDTLEVKYELLNTTENYEPRQTTHKEKVEWYFNAVMGGMSIEEVPSEFREEVKELLPQTDPTNVYGVPDEVYHQIIDDYTLEMLESE